MLYFRQCSCAHDSDREIGIKSEAHALLHHVLTENGISEDKQKFNRNKYGKPFLKNGGLHFNISHSSNLAVCAVADTPIGVDTELIRETFPERVMRRCFTEREIEFVKKNNAPETAFFQLWTLKESYIKAIGIGLSYPIKKAEFIIENDYITAITEKKFSYAQIIIDSDRYVCSVCCSDIFNNKVFYRSYEDKISFESLRFQT